MTSIPIEHFLIFSLIIFTLGTYGILTRRNAIGILISIELILNAVNVNLIAFSRTSEQAAVHGQIFALFIIAMAAAAAAVGLAIVLALYRTQKTIQTDKVNLLKW